MKFALAASTMAAVVASAASADITVTLNNTSFTGFNFSNFVDYTTTNIVGTLTGASINVTLNASTAFTYADDLCVYLDVIPLSTAGLVQVGGYSDLSASQRYFWSNGGSDAPGTVVSSTVNFLTPVAMSTRDLSVYLGNGYGAGGTSGTWTGSITLLGVTAVPAPGAVALLGLAGLVGRRRR